jgi:penicillin-binding protein 1C
MRQAGQVGLVRRVIGRVFLDRATRRVVVSSWFVVLVLAAWVRLGPLPSGLLEISSQQSTVLVDRNGEVLYESRGSSGGRAEHLSPDSLPPMLVAATLAAEDQRFWRHPGVDARAVARAIVHNVRRRRLSEGASTITQQVAKRLLARRHASNGPARRGLAAKLSETVVALRLEHHLTKAEILALYLNLASYGNQLVGAARASREYFGIDADLLTPAQAAFLAALPQRPTTFNPYRSPTRARARQQYVINRMVQTGALPAVAAEEARAEHLTLKKEPAAFVAPHFVQRVLSALPRGKTGRVVTTLDADLQRSVEGIIRSQRTTLARHGAHNVAVVVLENATGEWLAWEGSGDYHNREHGGSIDGVVAPRQPGSALKPFTYALAFEQGHGPATVLPDVPSHFPTAEDGILYSPQNYDGQFRGPLLARRALAGSENVPAVALAARLGVADLLRFLRNAGFTTFDKTAAHYGLGVTLGNAEVRLDELVAAYAAFANGGLKVRPTPLRSTAPGHSAPERLVSSRSAFLISDVLSDQDARAYVFGRGSHLDFPFAVAAKTGTSQAYHDNWAIGYTRTVTVGVWVGNFNRRPLISSSGVTGAGPIFQAVMLAAQEHLRGELPGDADLVTAATAEGLDRRTICSLSGLAATDSCPNQAQEYLPRDAHLEPCSWHQRTQEGIRIAWPAGYRAWASDAGLLTPLPLASDRAVRTASTSKESELRILNPPENAIYLIDPTLRREFQTLSLRAVGASGGEVEWSVDGTAVGVSEDGHPLHWPMSPGRHAVAARDRRGNRAETSILVK